MVNGTVKRVFPIHSLIDSAFRHLAKYMIGMDDEPHLRAASEPCRRCKHRDRFEDEFPCDECVHRQNGTDDMFYPADCKEDAEQ